MIRYIARRIVSRQIYSYIISFFRKTASALRPYCLFFGVINRLLVIVFTALPFLASGQTISGRVHAVADGNTVEIRDTDGDLYRVVLLGIDCPELSQPFGQKALTLTRGQLKGKSVTVIFHGKDRLGNYVGVILLKDSTDIRTTLLSEGLAWTAEKDPIPDLESLRMEALRARRGLWSDHEPVAPWIYRRQQSMLQPKGR